MSLKTRNIDKNKLKRTPKSEKDFYIIQLNCNGLSNKLAEIKMYIYRKKPEIFCLCETFIKKNEPKFIGYQSFWQHRDGHRGGIGTFVRRDVTAKSKTLKPYKDPQLELQCTEIFSKPHWIDILNIYNPNNRVTSSELKHYSQQLSGHSIIIGDFNAHSPVWDRRGRSNFTGVSIEQFLTNSTFGLLNDPDIPTYIDHKNQSTSCLDLCMVSRSLLSIASMSRGEDLGSDHFPIECKFCSTIQKDEEYTTKRWKYKTANWKAFGADLESLDTPIKPLDASSFNSFVSETIFTAAAKNIGQTSGKKVLKRHSSGWDEECEAAVKNRRAKRVKLWKSPTVENLIEWSKTRAKCRYLLKQKRQESFHTFISTIDCNTPSRTVWNKIKSIGGNSRNSVTGFGNHNVDTDTRAEQFLMHYSRFNNKIQNNDAHNTIEHIQILEIGEYQPITLKEVTNLISKLKNSSPGQDQISNQIIKKLPPRLLSMLTT